MRKLISSALVLLAVSALGEHAVTLGEYAKLARSRLESKIAEALAEGAKAEVVGTVTFVDDDGFFIQRDGDGLKAIASADMIDLPKVGDVISMSGGPVLEGGRVAFLANSWRPVGNEPLPAAKPANRKDLLFAGGPGCGLNWLRVEIFGRAIDKTENGFAIEVEGVPVSVKMHEIPSFIRDCDRTRPLVKVMGVVELLLDQSVLFGRKNYVMGVKLNVSSVDDVELVPDVEYLLNCRNARVFVAVVIIVALLGLGVAVLAWVIFRQKRRIFRSRTIMAERKRMADDLHDTIEQHLVGAGMLLKLNRIKEAQDVLVRAKSEIRDIVWGLKNDDMMRLSPAEMLRKFAHEETAKGIYRVESRLQGLPDQLPPAQMRDLSLIVREAIGNAVKHGGAKKIAISSDPLDKTGWRLRIANDGEPFDPAVAPGASAGHFGLEGMRQRARRLGASIIIERRGKGMVVIVEKK